MMLEFYKMTGSDHDFVMVDNRDMSCSSVLTGENIKDVCNRRFGIGAAGVIAVEPADNKRVVRMRYFNAEGEETAAGADALLCFTAFVDFLLDGAAKTIRFQSGAAQVSGKVNPDDSVTAVTPDATFTGPALIVFRGEVIICES